MEIIPNQALCPSPMLHLVFMCAAFLCLLVLGVPLSLVFTITGSTLTPTHRFFRMLLTRIHRSYNSTVRIKRIELFFADL